MSVEISDEDFEQLVDAGLDLVPQQLLDHLDNTVILIDDYAPEGPGILGVYTGVALTEQTFDGPWEPNTITIFREALKDYCWDLEDLKEQVAITVVHEIAHHFGIDDDRLHELGWG
ncbi:MAG: metallopeptidase family protein [Corynebacterium sp.]|nr:metallopeptidase family protein [Corynebacterium sp.]